jgi:glycosyltransferase involved in cell wall biosynthesis
MITFNHEKFIADAIEGVLLQRASFPIELVIGEDCSTDRTREICLDYQRKYPEVIRVLCRAQNFGMQKNFMDTIQSCRGEYVALCEGDDFWTKSSKLQEQVNFLEGNSDFAICHHRVALKYEGVSGGDGLSPNCPEVTTFEDLATRQHIATASCVFRNKLFEFPPFFLEVSGTDYALHLLNSFHGKINYLDEVMAVYRIHDQGAWSGFDYVKRATSALETLMKCRQYFYPRAALEIDFHIHKLMCLRDFEKKDFSGFRSNFKILLGKHFARINFREFSTLAVRFLLSRFPVLIRSYVHISESLKRRIETSQLKHKTNA